MTKSNQQTTSGNRVTATPDSLEEMITFIRQNHSVAFGIHQHLTRAEEQRYFNDQIEASTSRTPKINLDSSGSDEIQILKQQRVLSNEKQNNISQINASAAPNPVQWLKSYPPLEKPQQQASEQQQRRLPYEQLKRAVSSNLPCFLIEYDQTEKNRPSDVLVSGMIKDHFNQYVISIRFSLVGHMGNRLKLGVNNKESYATSTDKWPSQIKNINITVIKPKFVPDSFALVVRYVPIQYSDEYAKEEIERNLQSAGNVRRIQYRSQRRTHDYRFTVKDLREYDSMLNLGRISIGNTLCTITPFLTGNRMTYCTRCWCLGHMGDKCELQHPRCRIRLDNLTEGQKHTNAQI